MDHPQLSPRLVSSPSSGGCIYLGRCCSSQLWGWSWGQYSSFFFWDRLWGLEKHCTSCTNSCQQLLMPREFRSSSSVRNCHFHFFITYSHPHLPEQSPTPALQCCCIPVSLGDALVSHTKLWGVFVLKQRHEVPTPQTGLGAESRHRDMLDFRHSTNRKIHKLDEGVPVLESGILLGCFLGSRGMSNSPCLYYF